MRRYLLAHSARVLVVVLDRRLRRNRLLLLRYHVLPGTEALALRRIHVLRCMVQLVMAARSRRGRLQNVLVVVEALSDQDHLLFQGVVRRQRFDDSFWSIVFVLLGRRLV